MNLSDFLRRPDLWRRPVPNMPRSTQMRIYKGITDPKVTTAQLIATHSGRDTLVTTSTLTPLPLPRSPHRPAPPSTVIPVFQTPSGRLVGNFHSLAIKHRSGYGGTVFLAMMSLIASGAGWETWVIDPKGTDAALYFPGATRTAADHPAVTAMLTAAATDIASGPRERPLLISVDLAHLVVGQKTPDIDDAVASIIADGPAAGVFINIAVSTKGPDEPFQQLLDVGLTDDYGTAIVAGTTCVRPQLFIDYIVGRDRTDIDYRRYLVHSSFPDNRYATLAAELVDHNTPHAWGGGAVHGPTPAANAGSDIPAKPGFDAGSLSQYLHYQADGIVLPRTTFQQFAQRGPAVERDHAEPGDLIWPHHDDHPHTVATYLGNARAADAGGVGGHIRIVSLTDLEPLTITRPTPGTTDAVK